MLKTLNSTVFAPCICSIHPSIHVKKNSRTNRHVVVHFVWPGSPAGEISVWALGALPGPGPPSVSQSSVCPAARSWRSSLGIPSSGHRHHLCCCRGTYDAAETQSEQWNSPAAEQLQHMDMCMQTACRETATVCVCYLPALVELSNCVLHLSEWTQCLQLPQLHLLHFLLQNDHVTLIRQATAPLDGQRADGRVTVVWWKKCFLPFDNFSRLNHGNPTN